MNTKILAAIVAITLIATAAPMVSGTDSSTTVTNEPPTIESVSLDASLVPSAGSTTSVALTITVSDENGYQDIASVSYTVYKPDGTTEHRSATAADSNDDGSGTTQTYSSSFDMQFYDAPATGNSSYKVRATATDSEAATSDELDGTFNYTELAALNLSGSSISFGTFAPGARSSTSTLTVTNHGNVQIDIGTNGTVMTHADGLTISESNIKYDLATSAMEAELDLTAAPFTNAGFDLAPGASSTKDTFWQVAVPSGGSQYIPAGDYTGAVTISAISG